ncbi:hypothetical protein M2226_000002 [Bradyrhizobium elkanii]|uniref:HipA family kinase n=2 Tax=Bradyrhizobium elkanii TaxID=29448 RepID=UPI002225F3E6|nr:HipA family kinase [Bradyrhizobium elkanii]MCW2121258.1 hypothetical protein [Bradyrhizobium elkanii]MCW2168004.1 hypothetical protein [Bradyrhizobium elkanii]
MLATIMAVEYVRPMETGRTSPALVNCERSDGTIIPVVAKFSDCCDLHEVNLAREIIGACLAGDLGLPVPEPFIIEIPQGWSNVIPDPARRARIAASSRLAFGSALMTGGYSAWTPDTRIREAMVDIAAAIFAFDAIIQNPDRRDGNPNCLVRGEEIRILDHELAFAHRLVLGWRAPWLVGGLNWLERKGSHIFRADLKRNAVDFGPIRQRWTAIVDNRLLTYKAAIPAEWGHVTADVESALTLIRGARDNIDACLTEIRRTLS